MTKHADIPRTLDVRLRCTPSEKARIEALASERGQTVSDLLRHLLDIAATSQALIRIPKVRPTPTITYPHTEV